jgi:ribosomal protein S18 acetylase RimI-like enzyme
MGRQDSGNAAARRSIMPTMAIVDLRQVTARQLEPLLQEEARFWREELHWDYRNSIEVIRRFVDARSLAGAAVLENGEPAGYTFYVIEEHKGLVGGLYVSQRFPQEELAKQLLGDVLSTLRGLPHISRIEAQLMPFGCPLDPALAFHGFRISKRNFMLLDLKDAAAKRVASAGGAAGAAAGAAGDGVQGAGLVLERWEQRHLNASARLIQLAYANHVDGEINDQYRSESGALKFLKNIILLPGCGLFYPEASFVLRVPQATELTGIILTSTVAPGVAHTTQICVMPGYQGHGLGSRLLSASIQALVAHRYTALSLTVTASNRQAARLYEQFGFRTVKTFAAGVWQAE